MCLIETCYKATVTSTSLFPPDGAALEFQDMFQSTDIYVYALVGSWMIKVCFLL